MILIRITAYIAEGINPTKLESILEISIEQYKKLIDDLKETKMKLADLKDVEKAKILLMQIHSLSKEQAFQLI